MNIILVGAPASGKGTQAELLAKKYNLIHISTGDLLRNITQQNSELSNEVKSFIDFGRLVPDDLIIKVLQKKLETIDSTKGIIFDGFPRTVFQAKELQKIKQIDFVFEIKVKLESLIRRIETRFLCPKCNQISTKSEKSNLICDNCGETLIKRIDDNKQTLINRYNDYLNISYPIISFYKKCNNLFTLDGEKSREEIFEQICIIITRKK